MSKTGIIYKLVSNDVEIKECYVGSTVNFIRRKHRHKSNCNIENGENYNTYVYQFIRDNGGWLSFSMIQIEEFKFNTRNELNSRERYWIETLQAKLNKRIPTRTYKEYYENNKDKKKEYREQNKDKSKEYSKKYYENNKSKEYYEKYKDKAKEYREQNKDIINDKAKEYYENNKDIINDKAKEYREKNKDKIKEYRKEYREKNKDKIKEYREQNKDKAKKYHENKFKFYNEYLEYLYS